MDGRRLLLMYITPNSGHHRASCAIERTAKALDPGASFVNIDAFGYTSRFVRWAIARTYSSLIRHQPDIWEYLYDNPSVHRQIQYFRGLLHRYQSAKLRWMIDTVRPDAIVCTQAYPCGMLADFKKQHRLDVPLIGVLTDYAPHLYWFHDTVDVYVVPSLQVKRRFVARGVDPSRVKVLGIPTDPRFLAPIDRAAVARDYGLSLEQPIILIMGGGSGFGQLRDIVLNLDLLPEPCQLLLLTGTNRPLLAWVRKQHFRHRVLALEHTQDVPRLMAIATLLISKPGGMTTSEALTRHLPLVIVNPIPGQEAYNARYLLSQGVAVQASSPETVRQTVRDLLDDPDRLRALQHRNAELAHPEAAQRIAALMFTLADKHRDAAARPEPRVASDECRVMSAG